MSDSSIIPPVGRRGFLKGVFAGIVGSGLIVNATAREVEAFAKPLKEGQSLIIDQQVKVDPFSTSWGEYLYDASGNKIAVIREVRRFHDIEKFHTVGDRYPNLYGGYWRVEIIAEGIVF